MPVLYFGMSIALLFKLFSDGVKITNIHGWDLECSGRLYEVALNRLLIGLIISHVILLNECFWNTQWTIFSCNLLAVCFITGFYLFIRTKRRTTLPSLLGVVDKIKFQNINARDKANWVFRYSHPYIRILGTKKAIQVMNEINSPVSIEAKVHPLLEKEKRFNLPIPASSPSRYGADSVSNPEDQNDRNIISPGNISFFCQDRNGFTASVRALSNIKLGWASTEPDRKYLNNEANKPTMHTLIAESHVMIPADPSLLSFPSDKSLENKSREFDSNNLKVSEKGDVAGALDITPRNVRTLNHDLLVQSFASSPSRMSHFRREEQDIDYEIVAPELELHDKKQDSPAQSKNNRMSNKKLSNVQEIEDEEAYDHRPNRVLISNEKESFFLEGQCEANNTFYQNKKASDSPSVVSGSKNTKNTGIPENLLPLMVDTNTKSDIGTVNRDIPTTHISSTKHFVEVIPNPSSNITYNDQPNETHTSRLTQLRVLPNSAKVVKPREVFFEDEEI